MLLKTLALIGSLFAGPESVAKEAEKVAPVKTAPLTLKNVGARVYGADEVVDKIQDFYADTKTMQAKFRQTYSNGVFGKVQISDGLLYIKKPGKMRWDYFKKSKKKKKGIEKTFISDGKEIVAVEFDNKQIFKKDINKNMLPVAISFLYGEGDLNREFNVTIVEQGDPLKNKNYVLSLKPKTPSAQYKELTLTVSPRNFRVVQSVVHESGGNLNQFNFFNTKTNIRMKDSVFQFSTKAKAVKGFRIINELDK